MSRSYRKPYDSWGNMREDKNIYHRRHRSRVKAAIRNNQDPDELHTPIKNIETSDVWDTVRDGKQRYVAKPADSEGKRAKDYYSKIKRK